LVLAVSLGHVACSGKDGGGNQGLQSDAGSDAPSESSTTDSPVGDSPSGDASSGFGFKPSNLPDDFPTFENGDVEISGPNCGIVTDPTSTLGMVCAPSPNYSMKVVKQGDGTDVMVFSMKNLHIKDDADLFFDGPLPAVFVVSGKVIIDGVVRTNPSTFMNQAAAGGAEGTGSFMDGLGLGAGKKADLATKLGGGGGSFCGLGGGTNAGSTYGDPTCVPLLGGSSGGSGYSTSGAGGGAIQIVAKESIEVSATGVIDFGGGGGTFGSGGGAGGMILLESPTISIAGVLAANGGGGSGNGLEQNAGERGQPSGIAALGGKDTMNAGGDGSSESDVAGKPGSYQGPVSAGIPDHGGGSGGGAGRIRLNTTSGSATVSGTISPGLTTSCATQGVLAK
jgi:hypothetical protein